MRIATYNVEWFNALFDDDGRLWEDGAPSARYGISRGRQAVALGAVFAALEADAVLVVEAPDNGPRRSTVRALERFAARFGLRTRRALIGFANDTQQEIALLYDPDAVEALHDPQEGPPPRFDGATRIDLDNDGLGETVRFSKPPLEVRLTPRRGAALRLIGVHMKSKAPHGARDSAHALRIAIQNRRKQLAQCLWLRGRVAAHLAAGEPLIVLGDFNDGPGLDDYEALFGRSGVEIVLGSEEEPPELRLQEAHARRALSQRIGVLPASARFWLAEERRYFPALIDFVMLSPDLVARCAPRWRIWHPFDDPKIYADAALREALLAASDHFPVSVDLDPAGLSSGAGSGQTSAQGGMEGGG